MIVILARMRHDDTNRIVLIRVLKKLLLKCLFFLPLTNTCINRANTMNRYENEVNYTMAVLLGLDMTMISSSEK